MVAGQSWGQKVETVSHCVGPFQAEFGRHDTARSRSVVDRAVPHGFKLAAPAAVKDNTVDRIGKISGSGPVEHHVANGDLPQQGFPAALCGDDTGEPVEVVLIVVGVGMCEHGGSAGHRN